MIGFRRAFLVSLAATLALVPLAGTRPAAAAPEGQMTWAVHISFLSGQGPRVAESGLGLISNHAYTAPYEDVRLKKP